MTGPGSMKSIAWRKALGGGMATAAMALLAACGGGGGGSGGGTISTPTPPIAPTPAPAPPPVPAPSPTPAASFNTSEYNRSDGPDVHGAITAWSQGYTGSGTTIAVIDSGIDPDSPEFSGRLSAASRDVAGARGLEGPDNHGTQVALIAAAARDNTGMLGMAWGAGVLALRADQPGTCEQDAGCKFLDSDIARGVDAAIGAGAKVINISLGGGAPGPVLRNAVQRAAAAGALIIVSAGNDGDSTESGIDPSAPDPFAAGLLAAGGANVIIVGSVNDRGTISGFSNRAGSAQASFITAQGEAVCCVYENGVLKVSQQNGRSFVTLVSGTSFSAPQVAGAAALLAQAFPNLTGAQIARILLNSARDAGAEGIDTIYGTGILDVARAFAPQGTLTLAGGSAAVAMFDGGGTASAPMGDSLGQATLATVATDAYRRAYSVSLRGGAGAALSQPLLAAMDGQERNLSAGGEAVSLAFTVRAVHGAGLARPLELGFAEAEGARLLAGRMSLRLAPRTTLAFGYAQAADGLVAQLQGQSAPAFMIARGGSAGDTFARTGDASFALRQQAGPWGLTLSLSRAEAWLPAGRDEPARLRRNGQTYPVRSVGLAADRAFGVLETRLGMTWLSEQETVLGARFNPAYGAGGADSLFVDAAAGVDFGPRWHMGASFRHGITRARSGGLIASGSQFASQAFSMDLTRRGAFAADDTIGLRLSQPLRVSGGGLMLNLPISYDYETQTAGYGPSRLSLTPTGRELAAELAWRGRLGAGDAAASLFYRRDPGHYASLPDDRGVAVKWNVEF